MTGDLLDVPVWWDEEGNLLTENPSGGDPIYVMVAFERPMMEKVAEIICRGGGHVLNIGFGLGLVDDAIQTYDIESHTIVEPHPQVYARMIEQGWADRPGVTIHNCRWQDVDWSAYRHHFDGIFSDPYPLDESGSQFQLDQVAWMRLVNRIVKPETGVVVHFCVTTDPDEARRSMPSLVGAELEVQVDPCDVEVPFVIPEWRRYGVGRHRIYIPSYRLRTHTGAKRTR